MGRGDVVAASRHPVVQLAADPPLGRLQFAFLAAGGAGETQHPRIRARLVERHRPTSRAEQARRRPMLADRPHVLGRAGVDRLILGEA